MPQPGWKPLWWVLGLLVLLGAIQAGCAAPPASPPASTAPPALIFYDWEDDLPPSILEKFQEQTGIAVEYLTYATSEQAIAHLLAGQACDVLVMDNRYIPSLKSAGALLKIPRNYIPNFKNISPNFRDLVYDPNNAYSVPFNWGTTGLVYRSDLIGPVRKWADLWDPALAGRIAIQPHVPRDMIGLALKSLGYSANSEDPQQLQQALAKLLELKKASLRSEDTDRYTTAPMLISGQAVVAVGYAYDLREARAQHIQVDYVLPEEGALLWGDNFLIPRLSRQPGNAARFINFLLSPEVSAEIMAYNHYAMSNDAAIELLGADLLQDPILFPSNQDLQNTEILLPLSPAGQALYDAIWQQFLESP